MSSSYHLMLGRPMMAGPPSIFDAASVAPVGVAEKNPKSQLLEFFQKRQGTPQFTTTPLTKPPADPNFRCVVVCPPVANPFGPDRAIPETAFEGHGRSKKLAEQSACLQALELYRSQRLIGNLRAMQQQPTSPVPSPVSEAPQMYTMTQSPIPPAGSLGDIYLQPAMMQNGGLAMQPGQSTLQQAPVIMQQHPPTVSQIMMEPAPSYVQPVASGCENIGTGRQLEYEDEEDEEDYVLDNSDFDTRREEILSSKSLKHVQELAVSALEEILQLRQELFEARMNIKERTKVARKVAKAVEYLTQENMQI